MRPLGKFSVIFEWEWKIKKMHLNIFYKMPCILFSSSCVILIIIIHFSHFLNITCVDVREMIMLVFLMSCGSLVSYGQMQTLFADTWYTLSVSMQYTQFIKYTWHLKQGSIWKGFLHKCGKYTSVVYLTLASSKFGGIIFHQVWRVGLPQASWEIKKAASPQFFKTQTSII